jgi:ADP-ribose pyrophosphatase YjhB (NUDIX family)
MTGLRLPPWAARCLWALQRLRWRFTRPVLVGVRVILLREGEVALVRHTYRDGWFFPGGGLTWGETFEAAARREAQEELGVMGGAFRLHGLFTRRARHRTDHVAYFVATGFDLSPQPTWEIAEWRFFPVDALPPGAMPDVRARLAELEDGGMGPRSGTW